LRLNSPARIAQLDNFLRASRTHKIYMVVHDTDHLMRQCSAHAGPAQALHARDPDQPNARGDPQPAGLRSWCSMRSITCAGRWPTRFRGAIGLNDETEALAMRSRFQENLVRVLSRRREHHGRAKAVA